ncbi:MAG: medium chain dehydrogenase/reductase family protein [Bacteroidota bacterium]
MMRYKRVIITKYGGPEVLTVVEEPKLPEPKANEVRIKVLSTSACFTDTIIRKGFYPDLRGKKPPFSLGYDMIGVIDKLGEGVNTFKVGQRVADLPVLGAYSEYICLREDMLVPVPDGLDAAEAVCMILSYLTAYQMLCRFAHIKKGQRILITGAGGAVGTALLQIGKHFELEMYGTDSTAKHDLIKSLGGIPIDYKNENIFDRIKELTGSGVDAAFEGVGGKSFRLSRKCLKKGGILVPYGFAATKTMLQGLRALIDMQLIRFKFWNVFSTKRVTELYSIARLRREKRDWFAEDLSELFSLLSEGKLKPVIEKRIPLTEAKRAHELLDKGGIKGKLVLMVKDDMQVDLAE